MNRISRVLISVWDKTGIVELAQFLNKHKIEIISTGGTKKTIEEHVKKYITPEKINEGIEKLRTNSEYDSAVTVSSYNSYSPHRARKINKDGLLEPFIPFDKFHDSTQIKADRNSLGNVWFADMGVSIVRPHCLINWQDGVLPQKWMGNKIFPIEQIGGFDIDYEYELPMVEKWLNTFGGY